MAKYEYYMSKSLNSSIYFLFISSITSTLLVLTVHIVYTMGLFYLDLCKFQVSAYIFLQLLTAPYILNKSLTSSYISLHLLTSSYIFLHLLTSLFFHKFVLQDFCCCKYFLKKQNIFRKKISKQVCYWILILKEKILA